MKKSPRFSTAIPPFVAMSLAGCVPHFTLPMTAAQFANHNTGPALVAYLGQPDATPTVCDVTAQGPHLTYVNQVVADSLADGLRERHVEPKLWRRCLDNLLRSAPTAESALVMDALARSYRKLMVDSDFEKSADMQARLAAMHDLYIERPTAVAAHPNVINPLFADLRRAIAGHRVGQVATRYGEDLLATIDLEQGQWRGKPVDLALIDQLFSANDEKLLHRLADRLPTAELRDQARRRVIRIRIAASQFPEVVQNAAAVEEKVMKMGANPVSPRANPPLRGSVDPTKVPLRGVLVRQHLIEQTATLLGYSGDRPSVSVLPEVNLRGALQIQLKGISRPVTLCGPPKELDPSPCVVATDVKLNNPVAYLDKDGTFHFAEHVTQRDAINLAQKGDRFLLPVAVAGKTLLSIDWGLHYEKPEDLLFGGAGPGTDGPNLSVVVDHRDPNRFIYNVNNGQRVYLAAVEAEDAQHFHVITHGERGPTGYTGRHGRPGIPGVSGQSASCPSTPATAGSPGTDGTDGGPGGPGGQGGDGGNIGVQVSCGGVRCDDAMALLHTTIQSIAGAAGFGGPGGRGGMGGSGGRGGSGTSCSDGAGGNYSLPAAPSGANGRDGLPGPDGVPGLPGRAGRVGFSYIR
jgi:hypothetical protein